MVTLIAIVALVAILVWCLARGARRPEPAPEADVETPLDEDELADAERELADDACARPLHDGIDDDEDDWGPGAA